MLRSIEICAGAGGQALGLERAGFEHILLVEHDPHACKTLRLNRPNWNVVESDVCTVEWEHHNGVDLFAGGVPCPPFSKAGKQEGADDDRDLLDYAVEIGIKLDSKCILIENVRGLMDNKFREYRSSIVHRLVESGYGVHWKILNSSDYGVPQLRPRSILVALKNEFSPFFKWPDVIEEQIFVGDILHDLMSEYGWPGADDWRQKAQKIAPTLVGGSKKHGGPDLGPTRAKKEWLSLGVNGTNVMDTGPAKDFTGKEGMEGLPYLSIRMTARIQGFPDEWQFHGKKTNSYRQIGNAFPPPVSEAIGRCIANALLKANSELEIID